MRPGHRRPRRKKILIADDSTIVRMVERMVLAGQPYDLVFAGDGREAAEKVVSERPDLVLLDMVMPDMDGLEVLRRLRAQEETRATPVIMVTTRGEPEHIAAGYESGCNEYVTKPFDATVLLATIRRCLAAATREP